MFSSVLIANRGEIAVRVIRTAKTLGLRTIAVYSDEDAASLHVRLADEAYRLGPAEVAQSYLRGDRILEIAREAAAECIHPGYGFLSENAEFAEACADAGITFVGPPPAAIRAMGLKDAAKAIMEKAGVPVVPGYHGDLQDDSFLKQKAYELGYPLIIKAVAGGGGKGMRRVDRHQDFADALAACRREARSAFGDDRVLLERYVAKPRHIEIQVFGDSHGNVVHLFERDCSLQRRHQKVIEEAPAPGMSETMRRRMGEAALAAARAVGYEGAGTVEFIVDASEGLNEDAFYFMEMNTRLQVEHPVTEAITGLDLVALQLRVAAGEPLPFTEADLGAPVGHAVEARLYAEDPAHGFLPQSGTLARLTWPEDQEGLRIDTGVEQGARISPYYDPMIAKLIVWGRDREEAMARLSRALRETSILGLRTNLGFLERLLEFKPFLDGNFDTGLIDARISALVPDLSLTLRDSLAAGLWLTHLKRVNAARAPLLTNEPRSPWSLMNGWSLGGDARTHLSLLINGDPVELDLTWRRDGTILVGSSETELADFAREGSHFRATLAGQSETAIVFDEADVVYAQWYGHHLELRAQDMLERDIDAIDGGAVIRAPMSGKLIRILVSEGEMVERGTKLAVLEAMKMEHALVAPGPALVKTIGAREGEQLAEGHVVAVLERPSDAA
ncbi:acetyl/propionyl/methylcrotonyl-CoA carboxylase subunit alpha [Rhodoligotrophos ferricapiens]|uniref:acetyl/propionyl/methylcrotonyl-CoA carboxylase subunit alpha n=1 Tax=Rhodoligotrophos ferricapiens TaxID=3069264 RepID=UPI00315D5AA8